MIRRGKGFERVHIAVLLLAAASTAGSVAYAGDGTDDAAMKAKVEAALKADKSLLAKHIDVSVDKGSVRLGGFVQSERDIERVKKDVATVSGIKSVKNEMTVKPGSEESSSSGGN